MNDLKETLSILLDQDDFKNSLRQDIGSILSDPEVSALLRALAQDIWYDIVHAVKGAAMSQEARDTLLRNLTPEARIEISKADLATLQRGNVNRERLASVMGKVGEAFGLILINSAKIYLV